MTQSERVYSVQVGMPEHRIHESKEWHTGLYKTSVQGPLLLGRLGFEGDGQADLEHHGGPDKAVCVYSLAHYPYWNQTLGVELPGGAFGENISLAHWKESDVAIGDVYRMGEALVQISQPRQPCYKLGYRYGRVDMPLLIQNTGYTGWYFRVLEGGSVQAGDPITLQDRGVSGMTVEEANRIMYGDRTDREALNRLLAAPALSDSWKAAVRKRLDACIEG